MALKLFLHSYRFPSPIRPQEIYELIQVFDVKREAEARPVCLCTELVLINESASAPARSIERHESRNLASIRGAVRKKQKAPQWDISLVCSLVHNDASAMRAPRQCGVHCSRVWNNNAQLASSTSWLLSATTKGFSGIFIVES